MKLSRIIESVREQLDDTDATAYTHTSASLVRWINEQILVVYRKMVRTDENWFNYRIDLLAASAIQYAANIWTYELPFSVSRITEVRLTHEAVSAQRERRLHKLSGKFDRGRGWDFESSNEIRLYGFASPSEDITVSVAKRPAQLTQGTLASQSGITTSQLRIAKSNTYADEETDNYYVNGVFEMTGADGTGSHPVSGQIKRCTASDAKNLNGGAYSTLLTFPAAWGEAPVTLDTWEMHAEIPDDHLRLLVLLVCRAAWTKRGNLDEVRASRDELREEWSSYLTEIRPRDISEPKRIRSEIMHRQVTRGEDEFAWDTYI